MDKRGYHFNQLYINSNVAKLMIEVENLHKSFGNAKVLKGVSTNFEQGKTNLIIGQVSIDNRHLFEILYSLLSILSRALSILSTLILDKKPRLPVFIPTIGISKSFT